jgi:hypothetical protein
VTAGQPYPGAVERVKMFSPPQKHEVHFGEDAHA